MLISGREEPEAPLSPAMDAVIRIFKRISGLADSEGDAKVSGPAGVAFCSIRLLVASTQAINLIGKQGSLIKSIQESTGASVRVLSGGMLLLLHNTTFLYSVEYQWLEISPSSYHLFPNAKYNVFVAVYVVYNEIKFSCVGFPFQLLL